MRERALAKGVLTVLDNTEVTGLDVSRPARSADRVSAQWRPRGARSRWIKWSLHAASGARAWRLWPTPTIPAHTSRASDG